MAATQGDRGRTELQVTGHRAAGQALSAALQTIVAHAKDRRLGLGPRAADEVDEDTALARVGPSTQRPDGFLEAHPDGTFTRLQDGLRVPYKVPSTQALELRALLGMRDTAVELLEREARSNDDTPPLDMLRAQLNERYDAYARTHGPLNRFTERRTGRVDPDTGEEKLARVRPGQGGFYDDPYAMVVYALEHFDVSTIRFVKYVSRVKDGGGEKKYPPYTFVLNCKGDSCTGDVVMFEQNVYEMYNIASRSATGPPCGTRIVAGHIVKESYGAAKQQHTFTVLWSKGEKPLPPLHPLLIKGRNLYRLMTKRQRWADEEERRKVLQEKHTRGSHARCSRDDRVKEKEMRQMGTMKIYDCIM